MTAIARFLARKVSTLQILSHILRQAVLFCCAILFVTALWMTYGLDLSLGFF